MIHSLASRQESFFAAIQVASSRVEGLGRPIGSLSPIEDAIAVSIAASKMIEWSSAWLQMKRDNLFEQNLDSGRSFVLALDEQPTRVSRSPEQLILRSLSTKCSVQTCASRMQLS